MGGGQRRNRVFLQVITDMGDTEALEKVRLAGRSGGRGATPDYGVLVYVYRYDSELYYLPPDRNGDDVSLIGTQNPDRPER